MTKLIPLEHNYMKIVLQQLYDLLLVVVSPKSYLALHSNEEEEVYLLDNKYDF